MQGEQQEANRMKNNTKRIPGPLIEIGIVVVLALLCWIFVDVSVESILKDRVGSCISVVLDKPAIRNADRIVVYQDGQTITITDKQTVRQIAELFTVANQTGQCEDATGWRLEIYNGNRLVRKVSEICAGYEIYDRDLLHWVFPSDAKTGQVVLSREEVQWLLETIEQYK
jgi:hypothetical protein